MENALYNGREIQAVDVKMDYTFENEIREASSKGLILCKDPECKNPILRYCHGKKKDAYFAHRINGEGCEYGDFDIENKPVLEVQQLIYETLTQKGFHCKQEEKLLSHHYTNIVAEKNGELLAIDLVTSRMGRRLSLKIIDEYKEKKINVRWIVVDDNVLTFNETDTDYVERFILNESPKGYLIVVSFDGSILRQSCVAKSFELMGKTYYKRLYSEKAAIAELGIENGEISIEGFQARYRAFTVDQKKCAIIGIFSRKLQDAARYAIQQDFSLVEAKEYWKDQVKSVREENLSNEILDEETIDRLIDSESASFRDTIEPKLLNHYQKLCSERMDGYIDYVLKHDDSSSYEHCIEWICDKLEESEIQYIKKEQIIEPETYINRFEVKRKDFLAEQERKKRLADAANPGKNTGTSLNVKKQSAPINPRENQKPCDLLTAWRKDAQERFYRNGRSVIVKNVETGENYEIQFDIEKSMAKYHGRCYGLLNYGKSVQIPDVKKEVWIVIG